MNKQALSTIVVLCSLLWVPYPVIAAGDALSRVSEQARFWEQRGRYDLANDAWEKVLKIDPNNAEALTSLGANSAGAGDVPAAQDYLKRLRSKHPSNPGIARIEDNLLARDTASQGALSEARSFARAKEYDNAVAAYLKFFGERQPSGRVGLEFYQTLAGSSNGWQEAEQGLQRLKTDNPNDPQLALAYAEHLTYNEQTRRQGIGQLADLEQRPAVAQAAAAARQQALIWLTAKPADRALYRNFLKAHPGNQPVQKRLAEIQRDNAQPARQATTQLTPEQLLVKRGFEAMDDNNLDSAESLFRQALDLNADNAGALGGMGIVRLRGERFQEAEQLLNQASREQPNTAGRWKQALNSARFWSLARDADAARASGNPQLALRHYQNALAMMPKEAVVRVAYADTLLAQNELDKAMANYRQVLASDPNNASAQRGVINLLMQQGKAEQALAYADNLSQEQRNQIGGLSNLRAQSLRTAAEQAKAQGDPTRAEALLRDALALDPKDPYIRLDLARLYRDSNERDKAKNLVDGLLASEGNMADALFIKALILAEENKWWDGLLVLERAPANQRTQAMADLQQRLWIRYETERAVAHAREGQTQAAQQILVQVEQVSGDDPEALGALAQAYAEAGAPRRAVDLMREALSGLTDPSPGLRLQYAGLLSQLGQDVEFDVQLQALRRLHGRLDANQRSALANLEAGSAIRTADKLREQGRFADGYEYIRPHLEADPNNPALLMALARLYGDFKEPDQALNIYYDLLENDSDDLNTFDGAIRAAIDAGRPDEAQYLIERALDLAPANPRLYVLAGRLARTQGNDDEAVSLFKQALALDAENTAEGLGAGGKETRAPLYLISNQQTSQSSNPFGQARALRYEDRNRPLGPRSPVGQPTPAYLVAQNTAANDYRYSLPSNQTPPQNTRVVGQQRLGPLRYGNGPYANTASTAQPGPVVTAAPAQPTTAQNFERPVVAPSPAFQAAQQPTQLVRRRLDGPMRPEALPSNTSSINPRGAVIDEIADIQSNKSNWAAGGINIRNRDGQSGLGELVNIETPVEGSLGQFGPGRVRVRAVPVSLDSGSLGGTDSQSFGLLPIAEAEGGTGSAAAFARGADYDQSEAGVAIGAVYEFTDWRIDVGTSPLGFPEENLVGGLLWSPNFGNNYVNVNLSRRPVTDSLLSYAGTTDAYLNQQAGTNVNFGGVTRNGGRLDVANDQGNFGIYGNLGLYYLDGEQVEDNSQLELGGGYYQHLWQRPDNQFTVGLNVTTFFYDQNLSQFTLGHGGYFSPQFYASVGIPIEWVGRQSRLSYRLGGSLGVQSFSEDDSDIFPGNFGGAQTRLENAGGIAGVTTISGESNTGLGFNLYGGAEYLISPQLSFGARGGFDNAKDFNQLAIGAYLRYWFRPQRPDRLPAPRYLAPFYAGDPAW